MKIVIKRKKRSDTFLFLGTRSGKSESNENALVENKLKKKKNFLKIYPDEE